MNNETKIKKLISTSSEILGGTPVFKDTRVPISILFDYLKGGDSLQDFLDNYPTVKKSVAKKIIELSAHTIIATKTRDETAA